MPNRIYLHNGFRHKSHICFLSLCVMSFFCAICQAAPLMPEKYYKSDSAYGDTSSEQLFSPSVAQEFYQIAHESINSIDSGKGSEQQTEQAIIFLKAAIILDPRANNVLPDLINIASRYPNIDNSQLLLEAIGNYVDESSDIEIVQNAFRYLLERLNSREEREMLVATQLKKFTGRNAAVESELATILGLLAAEKADVNSALMHFAKGYNNNRYNRLAFDKIIELAPEQISAATWLEHLRLAVSKNPLDMQSAITFAAETERLGLYDTAAEAYQYCADLFGYLNPSATLSANIYLPLTISSYNSRTSRNRCQQIAKQLRQSGRFDLLVEAIASKAAEKNGDTQQAENILREAESAFLKYLNTGEQEGIAERASDYEKLAWFYCFAIPKAEDALDWANKAYSTEPNSPMAAALLAYSLTMNGQNDLAKSIIDSYKQNQISTLALAQIQLAAGQNETAIESLKSAIAMDPASLEAEKAQQLLSEHGGIYVPPTEPDSIMASLKTMLGGTISMQFTAPEKIISVQITTKGTRFPYGSDFGGALTITNNSSEPLIISDNGLFAGNIRVDAVVSGDIEKTIANLVTMKMYPSMPIGPGRNMFIPLSLISGELKSILVGHPQANLNIEFIAYIDPVTTSSSLTTNKLASIAPSRTAVTRPGLEISPKYLQNRLNSLSKGQQGQKIKTSELFTGLLAEQQYLAKGNINYQLLSADWMPELLTSAIVQNLTDSDWAVRVQTMAVMLSVAPDYSLTNAVAENLNDTNWPCRLMAEFVLSRNQGTGFRKVLDWTAKHDPNKYVRDMAVALGGAKPPEEKPSQAEKTETKPPAAQTSGRISPPDSNQ